MYILFFARGYLIFVGRKAGEHAKRRNVVDDRWKRERKEEVRGDESRMQRSMARQGYIGVKSEPAWKEQQQVLKNFYLAGRDKDMGPARAVRWIDRIRIAREEEAHASNRCLCEWKR